MANPLRLLMLEDRVSDAELILHHLRQGGHEPRWERVDTEAAFLAALDSPFDLILADYQLPQFDGLRALAHVRDKGLSVPFILVSGTIGEETAVEAMRLGASDYLLKDRLTRLSPAVTHALERHRHIQARQKADDSLRQSRADLAEAQRIARLGSWWWDVAGDRLTCSEELGAIYNLEIGRSDLPMESLLAQVHPDDSDRVRRALDGSLQGGGLVRCNHRLLLSDGSARFVEMRIQAKFDQEERLSGVIGTVHDVTEQRVAQEALRASEESYKLAVELANIGAWEMDPATTRIQASDRTKAIFGLPPDKELTFDYFKSRLHTDDLDRVDNAIRHAFDPAGDGEYEIEYRVVLDGGALHWVAANGRALFGGQNGNRHVTRFLGTVIDISARKHIEEMAQERNTLRAAVQAQERALGVVSHELRTPLAAIRAIAELLQTDAVESAEGQGMLRSIHDEAVRMAGMINDLLEAARLNSGSAQWNWSSLSLSDACQSAVDTVVPLLGGRDLKVGIEVEPSDMMMRGDGDAIRRLVLNLVNNACKFTRAGSVSVHVSAVEDVENHPGVEIRVSDTGLGMSKETMQRLGEAFVLNTGVVDDDHAKGAGLGLAICRGIVAAHGGSIHVASMLGKGTTFTVVLRSDLTEPVTGRQAVIVHDAAA